MHVSLMLHFEFFLMGCESETLQSIMSSLGYRYLWSNVPFQNHPLNPVLWYFCRVGPKSDKLMSHGSQFPFSENASQGYFYLNLMVKIKS